MNKINWKINQRNYIIIKIKNYIKKYVKYRTNILIIVLNKFKFKSKKKIKKNDEKNFCIIMIIFYIFFKVQLYNVKN